MRRLTFLAARAAFCTLPLLAGCAALGGSNPADDLSMEERMGIYMKYATPSAEHERLAYFEGTWRLEGKWRMEPEAEWSPAFGATVVGDWALGGRYLRQRVEGDPDPMMPETYENLTLTGFDNYRGVYISVILDNMSSFWMTSEGTFDEATRTWTYHGSYADPVEQREKHLRVEIQIQDDDHFVYRQYEEHDGEDFMSMEIREERQPGR